MILKFMYLFMVFLFVLLIPYFLKFWFLFFLDSLLCTAHSTGSFFHISLIQTIACTCCGETRQQEIFTSYVHVHFSRIITSFCLDQFKERPVIEKELERVNFFFFICTFFDFFALKLISAGN